MDVTRPPGFRSHNHMSRQPFGTLQKEGAQDRYGHGKATLLAQHSWFFCRCKELARRATHLQNLHTMITIRSSTVSFEPTLIALEAVLTTAQGIYTISSNSSGADSTSTFSGGLFGAISWPLSRFQLAPGVVLEQQIFLPHDGSAAAFSWQLYAQSPLRARLTIKPFFSGCGPRSYRDVGFRLEAEQEGGRLTWLPNVRGPKVIADTNGQYHDARTRFIECSRDQGTSASSENLVTPGRFEFELSRRPSVLIFSMEGYASTQRNQHVGAFLAGLIQEDSTLGRDLVIDRGCGTRTSAELVSA